MLRRKERKTKSATLEWISLGTWVSTYQRRRHIWNSTREKKSLRCCSVSQIKRDVMNKGLNVISSTARSLRNLRFSLPSSIPQESFCLLVYKLHRYPNSSRSRELHAAVAPPWNRRHLKPTGRKESSCFLAGTPTNDGKPKPGSDHKASSLLKDKYVYLSHIKPATTLEPAQCPWLSFQSLHTCLRLEKTKQQNPSTRRRPR